MNDAERAAAQAILAEKVKDCEGRRMEEVRGRDDRIACLEKENKSLKKQVRWLAEELVKASYSFTAQDWMEMARKRVKDGCNIQ